MNLLKNIVARFHGRCDHAMRAASDRLDAPLPLRRRVGLALHLWTCLACARASRQLELTHDLMTRPSATAPSSDAAKLDEAARQRIRAALESKSSENDSAVE